MQCFREGVNGRMVEIDDEAFFADGVRFPFRDLWGIRGVYYELSENAATAVAEGVGNVVATASGCLLGPIMGLCMAAVVITFFVILLGGGDTGALFPAISIAVVVWFIARGIGAGRVKAVTAVATKTFYLLIVSKNGEHKVLEGMPEDFLVRVSSVLSRALDASRGNESAKASLAETSKLPAKVIDAERGDVEAQCSLGLMYLKGDGVPVDKAKAIDLLRKSAEKGNPVAQYHMGLTLMEAGGDSDFEQASKWFSQASQNSSISKELQGMVFEKIAALSTKITEREKNAIKEIKNTRKYYYLASVIVILLFLLALLPGGSSNQAQPPASKIEDKKVESPVVVDSGPRIGTWEAFGKDRSGESKGILVLTKDSKGNYEGYLKWVNETDMETIHGTYNPKTKELVLQGKLIKKKVNGLKYKAYVSENGYSLFDGIWQGGKGGKWTAVWKNEEVKKPK